MSAEKFERAKKLTKIDKHNVSAREARRASVHAEVAKAKPKEK